MSRRINEIKGKLAFVYFGEMPQSLLNKFKINIKQSIPDREFIVTDNLKDTLNCSSQILVSRISMTNRVEALKLRDKINLQANKVDAIILLDENIDL